MLKDWLTRALAQALEAGEKTLSLALLEQHALSVDRCTQMITEAMAGETALAEDDNAAYRLRVRLGLEPGPAPQLRPEPKEKGQTPPGVASPRRSHQVGQRKPTRDPVKKEDAS